MPLQRLEKRQYLVLAAGAALGLGGYLLAAIVFAQPGFPLDDAWIHQVYARNLAWYGQFAFRPGQPSAGSTAPLWSVLLALGYVLRLPPLLWVVLLGWGTLFAQGVLAEKFARALVNAYAPRWPWIGLFFVLEWHHLWAMLSGMETGLFMLAVFWLLGRLLTKRCGAACLGFWIGGLVWLRPDALTLLGPAVVVLLLAPKRSWRERASQLGLLALTLGVPLTLYALLNLLLDGTMLPNTFYAKQTEYALLLQQPFWQRMGGQALPLLVGAGIVLLPGWVYWVWQAWQARNWQALAVVAWMVGYLGVYALRLPVTYQHGRYQMPVMPLYFFTALLGVLSISPEGRRALPVAIWRMSMAAILGIFSLLGARAYAADVAFISGQHVTVARWIAENLPSDALIAVHDIGAIGYFAPQPLLDLAGLISPEVIPWLQDETRLAFWLDEQGVDYLVTLIGWYNQLDARLDPVFCGVGQPSAPRLCVYAWP